MHKVLAGGVGWTFSELHVAILLYKYFWKQFTFNYLFKHHHQHILVKVAELVAQWQDYSHSFLKGRTRTSDICTTNDYKHHH